MGEVDEASNPQSLKSLMTELHYYFTALSDGNTSMMDNKTAHNVLESILDAYVMEEFN